MSGMFPSDEQCLSFNLPPVDVDGFEPDWLVPRVKLSIMRGLMPAVLLSLLAHIFLLPWLFSLYEDRPPAFELTPKSIHITLNYLDPDKPIVKESPIAELLNEEFIVPTPVPQINAQGVVSMGDLSATKVLEPIGPKQLKNLIQQNTINYDLDLSAYPTIDPLKKSDGSRHFNDVFHPGLREKLQNNVMHRSAAKYEVGGESVDSNGNIYVDLDNGHCLMAAAGGASGSTDWYHTKCVGFEEEGEEIMQRVNNTMRKVREKKSPL